MQHTSTASNTQRSTDAILPQLTLRFLQSGQGVLEFSVCRSAPQTLDQHTPLTPCGRPAQKKKQCLPSEHSKSTMLVGPARLFPPRVPSFPGCCSLHCRVYETSEPHGSSPGLKSHCIRCSAGTVRPHADTHRSDDNEHPFSLRDHSRSSPRKTNYTTLLAKDVLSRDKQRAGSLLSRRTGGLYTQYRCTREYTTRRLGCRTGKRPPSLTVSSR